MFNVSTDSDFDTFIEPGDNFMSLGTVPSLPNPQDGKWTVAVTLAADVPGAYYCSCFPRTMHGAKV